MEDLKLTPDSVLAFLAQQRTQGRSGLAQYYTAFEEYYDRK